MKKAIILVFLASLLPVFLFAQTPEDALRYSRVFYSGTARFNGLGGAFGAVGADFSTLSTNPAGLGLYRASEMSLTFSPSIAYSTSSYNGGTASDYRMNFGLGNYGIVFNINPFKNNGKNALKSINFGFGFNRQNDYSNQTVINGINSRNSMMQSWANTLNDKNVPEGYISGLYPFDINLAYQTNLVFYDTTRNKYVCDAEFGGVVQNKVVSSYGSMNELDFSVGSNLFDKLFVGMTFGVPFINYHESSTYRETRINDTVKNFISLSYQYDLHTRGTGLNFKFGVIYAPGPWARIGASIHTPTWYPMMRDDWSSSMQSTFTNPIWNGLQYSPQGNYDYSLTTPFRATGSLAFIIGQYGLFSADYEYVNYSQARFNSTYDSYSDINSTIQADFKSVGNLRAGTEWRLSNFRIRGGFGWFPNTYSGFVNNNERFQYSGGLGFRSKHFFADVTYVMTTMKQDYYLYDPSMVNPARVKYYTHTVLTTFGVRF